MQEGSSHSAEALRKEENAEMERDKTTGDDLQGGSFVNESSLRKMLQRIMKPLQNTADKRAKRESDEAHGV